MNTGPRGLVCLDLQACNRAFFGPWPSITLDPRAQVKQLLPECTVLAQTMCGARVDHAHESPVWSRQATSSCHWENASDAVDAWSMPAVMVKLSF